jgi:dihydrolipoamide dehydrogenase
MSQHDFQVMVIGAGPGGYAAAVRAAQLGFKVVCIDKGSALGGACLHVGCIPSKALLQVSEQYDWIRSASSEFGIHISELSLNFAFMMQRKQQIIDGLAKGIAQQFKQLGIEWVQGNAQFASPHAVIVGEKKISSAQIILAVGSEPIALPPLPFDEKRIVSSTGALSFEAVPGRLLIVGGGAIGLELASVYQRLGSQVAVVEMMPLIVPTMDLEVSKSFLQLLKRQGIEFYLSAKVTGAEIGPNLIKLQVEQEGRSVALEGDRVLVAVGRRPNLKQLGLEAAGIAVAANGMLRIDGNFRTSQPHIYAIGDIVEGPMLAHKASHEGIAVAEIIAGMPAEVNYATVPNVVYTHPEVAAVGLTEEEARAAGLELLIGKSYFRGNPRARCAGVAEGFVKVLAEARTKRLIGLHILSAHASEMISEGVVAINQRATLKEMARSMHPHPTLSEALMEACENALSMS